MKIRLNYVSNSSSSSYVIAYDKNFFGDIKDLFNKCYIGCESKCTEDFKQFLDVYSWSDKEREDYKNKIASEQKSGKEVIYIWLDNEYDVIIKLMKMINQKNGGDKLNFIFYGNED